MTPEYKSFWQMLSMRFLRGLISGTMGAIIMLTKASELSTMDVLKNYKAWIFSIICGAIVGGCLAVDKWIRNDGTDYKPVV